MIKMHGTDGRLSHSSVFICLCSAIIEMCPYDSLFLKVNLSFSHSFLRSSHQENVRELQQPQDLICLKMNAVCPLSVVEKAEGSYSRTEEDRQRREREREKERMRASAQASQHHLQYLCTPGLCG